MQNFNLHGHTFRCRHAEDRPVEDFIKKYVEMGFSIAAVTDHCPWNDGFGYHPVVGTRMYPEEKAGYLEEVEMLKKKYSGVIDLYCGFEVEYSPFKEEEFRQMRRETDLIILGQHYFLSPSGKPISTHTPGYLASEKDLEEYADMVELAFSKNLADILAHPDLFFLACREFGNKEEKTTRRICELAQKYDFPLEINLCQISKVTQGQSKSFVYPYRQFWETVSEYKIKVLYGIDAHKLYQLENYPVDIETAEATIGEDTIAKLDFCNEKDVREILNKAKEKKKKLFNE